MQETTITNTTPLMSTTSMIQLTPPPVTNQIVPSGVKMIESLPLPLPHLPDKCKHCSEFMGESTAVIEEYKAAIKKWVSKDNYILRKEKERLKKATEPKEEPKSKPKTKKSMAVVVPFDDNNMGIFVEKFVKKLREGKHEEVDTDSESDQ